MAPGSLLARNLSVLAVCQALFYVANTVVISTAPLVGLALAPSPMLATLPLGMQFFGSIGATLPASLFMQRFGRRLGLQVGCGFGAVSAMCGYLAVVQGWFALFCFAGVLYGVFSAFCQYVRFAAADAADASCCCGGGGGRSGPAGERQRARAISWVFAGGAVAAVAGPELAKATRDLVPLFLFAGSQLAVMAVTAAMAVVLIALGLPRPNAPVSTKARPAARRLISDPHLRRPFTVALVAYLSMNLLMTATPLAMLGCGLGFDESATVIQWHIVGMFAPSLATGSLIARFGPRPIILAGTLLIAACIVASLSGETTIHFATGLFLLGLGWNLMFVGATTMLTASHAPEDKARVQGLHDLFLFSCVAISASLSGLLEQTIGWKAMNLALLPGLLLVAVMMISATAPPAKLQVASSAGQ
jgi:MFS family permease